jgi:hypothetical protein
MVAMGVIDRALATAPIKAEGSRLGVFILVQAYSCGFFGTAGSEAI